MTATAAPECTRCAHGWIQLGEDSVASRLGAPPPEEDVDAYRRWRSRAAEIRNTVYPCRACNAGLFYRWAEGHLASDHDQASCVDCVEAGAGVRHKRRRKPDSESHVRDDGPTVPRGEEF